jgi:hypothetical protein
MCYSSSSVHSSSFEGVPGHLLSKYHKQRVWYSAVCRKVSIYMWIFKVLLREERFVSSHSHVFLYRSHRIMWLESRVGIVAARAVVTAQ